MKSIAIALSALFLLSACASTTDVSYWTGKPLDNLVDDRGTPSNYLTLADGNKIVEYDKGNCTESYVIDRTNIILGGNTSNNQNSCF